VNNLGDFLIAMTYFFFWLIALWVFVSVFTDIFRRDDLTGGMKAVWLIGIIILPLLGCLIYIISRPKVTPTDVRALTMAQAASKVSTADELQKLSDLKQAGVVSDQEYENLKAKIMASA
jgi:predicted membrane channel-forming protein YqfA (hemolysin III family)